ncbi:MAG TPA: hypothetical protein VGP90_13460, partial [Acidimicrobiia bacterium]|nr:hypothetical protein [Acidimicrobiia bacterium]
MTRLLAAGLLLAGGIIHFDLWRGGYRNIPEIGPMFLANFAGSIVLSVAVVLSRRATFAVGGIIFAGGSLAALVLSRTVGVFGFTETVWTSQAIRTLASEIGAIATLGWVLTMQHRHPR